MMRYHRVSPDCVPLSNGRKSNLRVCKEEENGRAPNYNSTFEGKNSLRYTNNRSGSSTSSSPNQETNFPSHFTVPPENHESSTSPKGGGGGSGGGGGDVLLQWGQHKRSRRSRTVTEESSASASAAVVQSRQSIKIQRRVGEKQGILNHSMPPPPPPSSPPCTSKNVNLRSSLPSRETTALLNRNLEERPGPKHGSPSRNGGSRAAPRSVRSPENKAGASCSRDEKANGSATQVDHHNNFESTPAVTHLDHEAGGVGGENKVFEWPRIYISLSRKEKEDDFMAMKGTKLPQRPKKRAKNVDKTLQYCFPGMWLSDLTRGRYEVREKKCVKKQKRRGLKGMESMETDSE